MNTSFNLGSYGDQNVSNALRQGMKWTLVSSNYVLRHLDFPCVVRGRFLIFYSTASCGAADYISQVPYYRQQLHYDLNYAL